MKAGTFLVRLLLGGCFLYAGCSKAAHLAAFCQALADYQFVPGTLVSLTALAVVGLEIVAGLSLLLGFLTQSAALLLALLSGAMAAAVSSAIGRGLNIPCGCFDLSDPVDWHHVGLNLLLLSLALFLLRQGGGEWSLDRWLGLNPPAKPPPAY